MAEEFPEKFGRYTLLQRVAFGGMAEILLAIEDTPHAGKRFVTIKRIRSEYASDPDYNSFFISEGRISMQCSHPNLTRSFELDTVDGVHFLAMEYIRGHTLLDLIRACYRNPCFISIGSVLRICAEVAAGLEHLHGMADINGTPLDVIHRDVTPQNIMIDAAGSVKLIDLGIARSAVQVHETQVGTVKGKLSYIAPEQLRKNYVLDQRADIFSLGIVLYESLTNRGLFRGKDDLDTLKRIRKMPIPKVSDARPVAAAIDELVSRALAARDPQERFQCAADVLKALDALPAGLGPNSRAQLRDEVLQHCGDPPIATLNGESFGVLRSALNPTEDLAYFLERCGLNNEELADPGPSRS